MRARAAEPGGAEVVRRPTHTPALPSPKSRPNRGGSSGPQIDGPHHHGARTAAPGRWGVVRISGMRLCGKGALGPVKAPRTRHFPIRPASDPSAAAQTQPFARLDPLLHLPQTKQGPAGQPGANRCLALGSSGGRPGPGRHGVRRQRAAGGGPVQGEALLGPRRGGGPPQDQAPSRPVRPPPRPHPRGWALHVPPLLPPPPPSSAPGPRGGRGAPGASGSRPGAAAGRAPPRAARRGSAGRGTRSGEVAPRRGGGKPGRAEPGLPDLPWA